MSCDLAKGVPLRQRHAASRLLAALDMHGSLRRLLETLAGRVDVLPSDPGLALQGAEDAQPDQLSEVRSIMLMPTIRVVITLGLLAGLCADLIPQGAQPATSLYVNVETGDDVNPGSASAPFKTLNKALQQAYDLRNPPPGTPLVLIERVFI